MFDVKFGNNVFTASPKMDDLVDHVMAYLELLNDDQMQHSEAAAINQDVEMLSISDTSPVAKKRPATAVASPTESKPQTSDEDDDDRKKALRIAKTGEALFRYKASIHLYIPLYIRQCPESNFMGISI